MIEGRSLEVEIQGFVAEVANILTVAQTDLAKRQSLPRAKVVVREESRSVGQEHVDLPQPIQVRKSAVQPKPVVSPAEMPLSPIKLPHEITERAFRVGLAEGRVSAGREGPNGSSQSPVMGEAIFAAGSLPRKRVGIG